MVLYAGRSIGQITAWNEAWNEAIVGRESYFYDDIPPDIHVNELDITFRMDTWFKDSAASDHKKGWFDLYLYVKREDFSGIAPNMLFPIPGYVEVDHKTTSLGTGKRKGEWEGIIEVSHHMELPAEIYLIIAAGRKKKQAEYDAEWRSYGCIQAIGAIGDFTLDFVPLSIVYCPPGQDMTNSLSHTTTYATNYTIGNSHMMQSSESQHMGVNFLGILSWRTEYQESQTNLNTAETGVEISEFRRTVVTADNQRAIGRAYWGPLSDLFLIMVNPKFSASKRADGTIFYEHNDCDQLLIVPAHKLLSPEDDPVISQIPAEDRKKLLALDPFIHNIDRFFPTHQAEGIICFVKAHSSPNYIPVLRITIELPYGEGNSSYFYTANSERYHRMLQLAGFKGDGVIFYVLNPDLEPLPENHTPLYHLTKPGDHLFTTSEEERDSAINNNGYRLNEGNEEFPENPIIGYVLKPDENESTLPQDYVPLYKSSDPSGINHFYTISKVEYERLTIRCKDLSIAANPYADPTSNYRAECIGLWYLTPGTELNYSIGNDLQLKSKVGQEIVYTTSMRGSASVIIGQTVEAANSIGIQWSKEVKHGHAYAASCYLIKNQNDPDQNAIKLYYDNNFGTIMFRKVLTTPREFTPVLPWEREIFRIPSYIEEEILNLYRDLHWPERPWTDFPDLSNPELGLKKIFPDMPLIKIQELASKLKPLVFPNKSLLGTILDLNGMPVFYEKIKLLIDKSVICETITDGKGQFRIDNLHHGNYSIQIGNQIEPVNIDKNDLFHRPKSIKIKDVKRILDFNKDPLWKFRRVAGLTSDNIRHLRKAIREYSILNKEDLSIAIQKNEKEVDQIFKNNLVIFPKTSLSKIKIITPDQIKNLEKIKIISVQDLWLEGVERKKLSEISNKTKIEQKVLSSWLDDIDSNRASKHEY